MRGLLATNSKTEAITIAKWRRQMRAVIITQDEPFATPVLLEELLGRKAENITAIFIAPPTSKRESFRALAGRWWNAFGPMTFVRYGVRYTLAKLLRRGPAQVARRHGVPVADAPDINAPDFLDELRALEVDLIISVACPQIFRPEILALPPRGCINVHSGMLPKYRGQLPTFWTLYYGETDAAVTVHYMNAKVDDGPILLQETTPIEPGESQGALMIRCKQIGGRLLARALDMLDQGEAPGLPNPRDEATYFSFPTRDEGREFRRRGGKWL